MARYGGAINDSGDGISFFLAPFDFVPSAADPGEWLGLFKSETDGNSSNQILAVEFDTYKNDFDPDDNHVGIDVNSVKSQVTFSVSGLYGDAVLNNGEKWEAWVEYYGALAQLQVFLSYNPAGATPSKPENPVLWYDIDLSQFLPHNVKIGISAYTGIEIETHMVYLWSFSCQDSLGALPTTQAPIRKKKHQNFIIIIIVLVLAITITIMLIIWRSRSTRDLGNSVDKLERGVVKEESDEELDKQIARAVQTLHKFSYAELSAATDNFSENQKIGDGGFGSVYLGILAGTNQAVAVKRMDPNSKGGQGEYVSEVIKNSKLTHCNLVEVLGWCHQNGNMLLVYELLPNGSLDKYIFEDPKGPLDWDKRYAIACDVASGLVYLHHDRREAVLHKDIKAANVMLDSDFRAKLGDFGLARALESEEEELTNTKYGTVGYMAPELALTGIASRESDVFSFGALTLEIACGKRPVDNSLAQHHNRLVEWVWHLHGQNRVLDAADEKLGGEENFNDQQMKRLMLVGLWFSHPDPNERPSMKQVLNTLERGDELLLFLGIIHGRNH
ncbi:probable L-type lectin-domain containing receptor kinase S.7 [Cryptomeria japonica]|uniref:probable L-type lectin-domain containing receptor kinase S.7 n=1 Tax=Cryptomeria japonica TaxID=3369 RepID=UPI0027DA61A5|nr:probable L-type lectin-domain containing receptor kinase S.7 [Cryptomeria japonica]